MQRRELSANQVVALNLGRLRRERGWSAGETADRLGQLLGRKISLASYSAMERSVAGKRIKAFDADESLAISQVFSVPLWHLFQPPKGVRIRLSVRTAERLGVLVLPAISIGPEEVAPYTVYRLPSKISTGLKRELAETLQRAKTLQRAISLASLRPTPIEKRRVSNRSTQRNKRSRRHGKNI